jgi:hypothetical protein
VADGATAISGPEISGSSSYPEMPQCLRRCDVPVREAIGIVIAKCLDGGERLIGSLLNLSIRVIGRSQGSGAHSEEYAPVPSAASDDCTEPRRNVLQTTGIGVGVVKARQGIAKSLCKYLAVVLNTGLCQNGGRSGTWTDACRPSSRIPTLTSNREPAPRSGLLDRLQSAGNCHRTSRT